jgi:hypothetical protein
MLLSVIESIVMFLGCHCSWGMDWWVELLTTYTHHSELQVITALSLISTLYKSPQHPLSLFPAFCAFISHSLETASNSGDSWLHTLRFYLHSLLCRTHLSTDSRTIVPSHLSLPCRAQLNWQPSTELVRVRVRVRVTVQLAVPYQSVHLGAKPLEIHNQYFFFPQQNTCGYSPYITSSLTRGWVCHLQLLLGLASTIIIRSESCGTFPSNRSIRHSI